jgi:hypothetical protein
LLQVHELLKLASHQARGNMVPTESCAELGTQHLVAVLNSDSEVSPLSIDGSTKLLDCEQILLFLSAMQKTKLELNDMKPVIHIQRISRLGK